MIILSIMDSIVRWAQEGLPEWQSDVVRRLLNNELTEEDESEIFLMLKDLYGLNNADVTPVKPIPLTENSIPSNHSKFMKLTLKSMDNLQNVNTIPDGSNLSFGHEGLSAIYRENGVGKSGYARVLKKACKARDSKERIIPNIFEDKSNRVAQASFKYSINDKPNEELSWTDGLDAESALSYINVFDTKSANIIVDEKNEVTYLPEGAQVFEGLVSLISKLKGDLEQEKPVVAKLSYRDIDKGTEAGKLIEEINHTTAVEKIKSFAVWSDADEFNLTTINKDIASLELYDPLKQAKKIRNIKSRTVSIAEKAKKIEIAFSKENVDKLNDLISKYEEAKKAVKLASQVRQDNVPLGGFGESAWQILFSAARDYSTKHAYPDKDFPVINEQDSRCVLCMQVLSDEAKDRLKSFSDFMKDTTKQHETAVLDEIGKWEKYFKNIEIPSVESIEDVLHEVYERDKSIDLEGYLKAAATRSEEIIQSILDKQKRDLSKMIESPNKGLIQIGRQLEEEAIKVEKNAKPEETKKLKERLKELSARKLFTQRKHEILDYLYQLKLINKYENCIEQLKTNTITRKGKSIISSNLTPSLIDILKNEMEEFGFSHLPLSLKSSGNGGGTHHQISFIETRQKAKLSEILSEGEQRIVALAGFFSELRLGEHKCPIVFDDPVSSLDHRYREKIAERLVKESIHRQVIVFTHDIAFLIELEKKAGEYENAYFSSQTVRRVGERSGKTTSGRPWHAMSVEKRIKYLKNELNNFKGLYQSDIESFNDKAATCYGLLRETWESFIEEILFNDSIHRHSSEVHTLSIKAVEVTTDYVRRINMGMSKCSKWMIGHDKSMSIDVNRPSPDEIMRDIEEIVTFKKEINKRGEKVRRERDAALEPKQPSMG